MSYPVAGFLRRFYALFVDCLILEIAGGFITFPLVKKLDLRLDAVVDAFFKGEMENLQEIAIFLSINMFVLTLLWTFYFVYFIGSAGQTLGKKLMRIKVVPAAEDNVEMDYKTAFNRFLGLTVSASALFIGFIWALFNDKRQTWHDLMANTIVIKLTSS
ncbi:MAG: RDD family protein [Nitrospinota bacterium]|nr:RDD family protein [Nitrospinota bacterium]